MDEDRKGDLLTLLGYEVDTAKDGSEAIELYKSAMESERPFCVVIMDLTIPGGMGGKQAIERLLEIDPKIKAIVSSGYSSDPVMSNFEQYGSQGIVRKPYTAGELSRVLHRVIHGSENKSIRSCDAIGQNATDVLELSSHYIWDLL